MSDIVIGRRGDSLTGQVQQKKFTIRTAMGTLTFATKHIAWIHFAGPTQFPTDEMWLHSGDKVSGTVSGNQIRFKAGGQILTISTSDIHTLMLGASLSKSAQSLTG